MLHSVEHARHKPSAGDFVCEGREAPGDEVKRKHFHLLGQQTGNNETMSRRRLCIFVPIHFSITLDTFATAQPCDHRHTKNESIAAANHSLHLLISNTSITIFDTLCCAENSCAHKMVDTEPPNKRIRSVGRSRCSFLYTNHSQI